MIRCRLVLRRLAALPAALPAPAAALAAAMLFSTAAAAQQRCPSLSTPVVEVTVMQSDIQVANDLEGDPVYLETLPDGRQAPALGKTGTVETAFNFMIQANAYYFGFNAIGTDNRACATASNIRLSVGFPDVRLRVAAKYPPDSCAFQASVENEQRRFNLVLQALQEALPQFQTAAFQAAAAIPPQPIAADPSLLAGQANAVLSQQTQAHARAVEQQLVTAFQPIANRFEAHRQQVMEQLDRPEAFARVASQCQNW